MRRRQPRIDPGCCCMRHGGLLQPPGAPQEIAEIGVRGGVSRIGGDGLAGGRERLLATAERAQDHAEIGQRAGMIRPPCKGASEEVCSRRVVAEPMLDQSEVMQGRGMVRVGHKDEPQRRGRVGEPAGAQMLCGGGQLGRWSRSAGPARGWIVLVRGPPLLPVHRSSSQPIGGEARGASLRVADRAMPQEDSCASPSGIAKLGSSMAY